MPINRACTDRCCCSQPYQGKCKDCKQTVTQNKAKYCHGWLSPVFPSAVHISSLVYRLCVQEGHLFDMWQTDTGYHRIFNVKQIIPQLGSSGFVTTAAATVMIIITWGVLFSLNPSCYVLQPPHFLNHRLIPKQFVSTAAVLLPCRHDHLNYEQLYNRQHMYP